MKYITGELEELDMSYIQIKKSLAYKDIVKFLIDNKLKAQKKLKLGDDPDARATWNLVDNFFTRINDINKEVCKRKKEE